LYTGKTISLIGSALLGIFLPIFLYELFNKNFQAVIIYYGIGYLLYAVSVTVGGRFLNRFGFRKALRVSVILGALFYVIFYFIAPDNWPYLVPLAILAGLLYRLFYWLPYHVDFAKFTDKKNRARQVGVLNATRLAMGIFIPLLAGLIIARFGFDVLFVIAIILFIVSGIPYLTIPRTREKFSWSWLQTWQEFFSKKRRRMVFAYMADGAERTVGLVVWPIFIYQILEGNYLQVGAVSTFIIGFTVILQLVSGRYIDLKTPKEKVLRWGSAFYAIGWLIKIFITTAFQIFIVGTYHNVSKIFIRTPFDVLTYEIAADQGHYVDEFTVLHEIAINFGKALIAILVIVVSLFLAIQWVFILAALAAILLNILKVERRDQFDY
jgi:MFS family permease